MTERLTNQLVDDVRSRHLLIRIEPDRDVCAACGQLMPCDALELADELEAATARLLDVVRVCDEEWDETLGKHLVLVHDVRAAANGQPVNDGFDGYDLDGG